MVGAVATGIVIFALGVFLLWLLVYGSGMVRPKVQTEPIAGAPAMERKLLFATALIIFTGVFLTGYGFWDPIRQADARERQLDIAIKRGVENYAVLCFGCHGEDGKGAVVPDLEPKRVTPQLNREQFWVSEAQDPDAYKANFELVNKTIHRGRNQIMPAWGQQDGGTLNDEQIYELTVMILNGNRKPNLPRDAHFDGTHTTWEVTKAIVEEHIAAGSPRPIPVSEAAPPLPPELQAGRQVFEAKGCVGCHVIQGIGGAVGPELTNIATTAESRVPGKSAEEYLRESILNSQAFVVPNYPPVMPSFQGAITDQELNDLIQYLQSLK